MISQPFTATVTGSPRIGPKRELKRATEGYWAGRTSRAELESVAATLRRDMWSGLAAAGLDSVPVNTFSYYDQMLDTAVMLGALPARATEVADELDRYFAARARQRKHRAARDDEVVRHQLPLPGSRDRARDPVCA